ncbi:MAG: flavin reductase [Lachnospiraceae bacterium]|jgi:flavin reductase (DIM6/NTAB) family NADH-FMN oxidoreductase RutF/rubredoxin|nr:flavin reductase [Lachnospiraceae bacterium]MEE3461245.1 flavin reductase [Lachnospiraceae bacterium]
MNNSAMYKLTYGLFVLTVNDGSKANGCIVNTVMQQTSEPNRVSVTVNKHNLSEEVLEKTGEAVVSFIDESADFELFKHFGFQSGRNVNKFEGFSSCKEASNGVPYITKGCNGYLVLKVAEKKDLGSHMFFLCDVIDGDVLSDKPSMTYAFYHANVKPKPEKKTESKGKVWVCRICGYEYDDSKEKVPFEELPDDWECPICGHGKADFVLQE